LSRKHETTKARKIIISRRHTLTDTDILSERPARTKTVTASR